MESEMMEIWGPAILYLIGSGAILKIIELLVKRHDAKAAKHQEQYHALHVRLCEYKDEVSSILLEYFRTTRKLSDAIDEKDSLTDKYIAEIEDHLSLIKKQKSKCKKQKAKDEVCAQCSQRREQLPLLLEKLQKEQNEAKGLLAQCRNYWHNNEEHLYKSIAKYLSLHNYLLANKIRDKGLYKKINDIDMLSLDILMPVNNRNDLSRKLINLMKEIECALIMLSKKM